MTKICLALSFLISVAASADHAPSNNSPSMGQAAVVRFFYKTPKFSNLIEYKQHTEVDTQKESGLTLGSRYRLHRNFKAGLFFSRRQGLRHDDDWVKDNNNDWVWQNTNNRAENFVIFELSPRMLLPFLSGKTWVFEFRMRGERNLENDHNSLKLKPGLTYFWLKNGAPFMNFFLQYEAYLPLNYGTETIYQTWIYTGFLFHWSKRFKPGLFFTKYEKKWGPSATFNTSSPGETYLVTESSSILGLSLNINFN
ncbi:MAG: hypothetical protein HN576_04345 [Bacteriovoracaceae bacterium]|jgi:hypothetical protein|nr:hypothetical protein [Bacteriovoracaceae bacterium]